MFFIDKDEKSKTDIKVHNLASCFVWWLQGKSSKNFFVHTGTPLTVKKLICDFLSD